MTSTRLILNARRVREWVRAHPTLREIIADVVDNWPAEYCQLNDIHRSFAENEKAGAKTQIHVQGPPWRAADFGARDLGRTAGQAWDAVAAIADKINAIWIYDPARPAMQVAVSSQHGTGPHLHVQVCATTQRRAKYEAELRTV